jgi:LysM repeat protein
MTRETKIGLLVGLAFIIVIGILLSDHMTSTTQPPQAALAETAKTVGSSVTAPAPTNPLPAPIGQTPPITPTNQVPTRVELHPPTPPVVQNGSTPITQIGIGGPAVIPQPPQQPIAIKDTQPPIIPQPVQPEKNQVADGRPIVPANPPAPEPQTKKEYIAQAGDNLSKLATKMLGTNSKANRDAIVKANPSLQKNPDLIVEGRKYTIPQAIAPSAQPPAPTAPSVASNDNTTGIPDTIPVDSHGRPTRAPIPVTDLVDTVPPITPAAAGGTIYVVKEKDTLWKIAKEQLGSGSPTAIQQIKDLNTDILKGGDIVQPSMRLKIPAKSIASAR